MVSIITPTYNRKEELKTLYESLKNNIIDKLEWIIVDDGSNDNTEELVKKWIKEDLFKIKYLKQKNMGKMSAINNGIKYISNQYMFEIDSDDYLVPNFLKNIKEDIEFLEKNEEIYGLAYLKNVNNEVKKFDNMLNEYILKDDINITNDKINSITMFKLYNKYLYNGELLILFKTVFRKKVKYELENNEKFITEGHLFNTLDKRYKGIFLKNEIALICKYQKDGYTRNINKIFFKNPYGYLKYYRSCLEMNLDEINKNKIVSFVKNYLFFGYIIKSGFIKLIKNTKIRLKERFLILILYIPGYLKYLLKYKKTLLK